MNYNKDHNTNDPLNDPFTNPMPDHGNQLDILKNDLQCHKTIMIRLEFSEKTMRVELGLN